MINISGLNTDKFVAKHLFSMMRLRVSLLCFIVIALFCSCSKGDDVEEIFRDKTMYITSGLVFNNRLQGTDLKELCASPNTYCIYFGDGVYSLTLAEGFTMSGQWTADGDNHTIHFSDVKIPVNTGLSLSYRIANVFEKAVRYSGDANLVTIIQDEQNRIVLSAKRSDNGIVGQ